MKKARIRIWSGNYFHDYYIDASHVVDNTCDWAENKMIELEAKEPGVVYEHYEILADDRAGKSEVD